MTDDESTRRIDLEGLRAERPRPRPPPDEELRDSESLEVTRPPASERTSVTASIEPKAPVPIAAADDEPEPTEAFTADDLDDPQNEIPTNDAAAADEAAAAIQSSLLETTVHDRSGNDIDAAIARALAEEPTGDPQRLDRAPHSRPSLDRTDETSSTDPRDPPGPRDPLESLPRFSLHDDDDGTELLSRNPLHSFPPEDALPAPAPHTDRANAAAGFDDVETTITHVGDLPGDEPAAHTEPPQPDPADEPEPTRMGRFDRDEVAAAFAAAEANEPTAMGYASDRTHDESGELLDAAALESVEDVDDDGDESSDVIELDEEDLREETGTEALTRVVRPGSSSDASNALAARSALRASMPPTGYTPPTPAKPLVPAYAVDQDDDERQLVEERSFEALLALYRERLDNAQSPSQRAALLHKIGSVYEWEYGDADAAFDALLEGFELRPVDDELAQSLDRVAKHAGRVQEIADRAKKNLVNADHETRMSLLGHLVYWHERLLGRGGDASVWVAELERTDKSHPVSLRRAAQVAAQNGDLKGQRDLLQRALERAFRRDERVALHLQLASATSGTPEAAKHYDAAVAIDPTSIVALQGIARLGREQNKHAQVEWALEQQVEVAPTESEKVNALLDLGELMETKFLRRDRAAEIFEIVLQLEPSNPAAMKALERCYHAIRDWPKLAAMLRRRAEHSYDKKQQVELLVTAAEVYESKLNDAASAVEANRELLHVDPKHRRALADLARLYEKLGDWGNLAIYKARAAELAPSKRQASQLLVQLGDQLMAPDRDPIAAELQYVRASQVDPGNAAAWEALQKIAAAAGDDRRVAECLDARVKAVEAPRQRAAVLVELARFRESKGDARAARAAYEQAVKADATNEAAAAVLLEAWTAEEQWGAAAPLCELLVNAAVRDHDEESLFTRLRLQTRIAAALGDADKAMSASLAALDARPDDADAQADLIAVCSQCRESPKVIARAKEHLARIAKAANENLHGDLLVKLAQVQRDVGNVEEAQEMLERARRSRPDDAALETELADVYLAQKDYPRACKLKIELARNTIDAEERFRLLREAAEIWEERAGELRVAAQVYEEARAVKPLDPALLHRLVTVYTKLERWDLLANVLTSIVELSGSDGDRKVKSLIALAEVLRDKLLDPMRAATVYDEILDLDAKKLEAFEALVRTLTEAKDWQRLEVAYRRMLARIEGQADDAAQNLRFVLFHQLGLIYRDRLEDAEQAFDALDAASRIRPDDGEVRRSVNEILVVTDNLDNAVARTRQALERNPHDPDIYAELYDLFLRQHYFDKAWCAVNVLAGLQPPTAEQAQFHEDYAPMPLAEVPGQIIEHAWRSHVFHPELDPTLSQLFALMTPAVARMRQMTLPPNQQMPRPFTPTQSRLYDQVRTTFGNAAEILGLQPPELLLGDPNGPFAFTPAYAPFGAVLVTPAAVEARADALTYVIGKKLAEQRPEIYARAFFPSPADLATLLAAAVRVSRQEGAKDTAATMLDQKLSAVMAPHERDGIRSIVMQADGPMDPKRWAQCADLSSMRAGLLLCGDVEAVKRTILSEPQMPSDLTPREKIAELYKFALSDTYSDLRGAIGVAVTE